MPISRRNLLVSSLATAAASTLRAFATPTQETGKPAPIKLGMCSYTFRNFTRNQMIAFLKQIPIDQLNVKDVKDHLPSDPAVEAQAVADYHANGIRLHAAGAIYFRQNTESDIRRQFDYVKRAGIPVIVAGDPTIEMLPLIDRFVKEYDIQVAIHNHGPEDNLWPSPLDVYNSIRGYDRRIGCCIDVGHTVRAGTDAVQAIRTIGPRVHNIHMKDLTSFTEKQSQVAVGQGKMPVREIFQALIDIQYPGFVDLEYEVHADNPMPGVLASINYMRGVLTGMGYMPAFA